MSEILKNFITQELDGPEFKAELAKVSSSCSPERFVTILKNYIKSNPKASEMIEALGDASNKLARQSLLRESLKCAADGLVPDGREASIQLSSVNVGTRDSKNYVKVFQYMPMVIGITKTLHNTGLVSNISLGVIHENDTYDYDLGSSPKISHKPALKDRGERVAAYASVTLKGHSHPVIEFMTADEVNAIAERSRSKTKDGRMIGPWATDTGEMWKKTALRRLSKRLPRSDSSAKVDAVLDAFDQDFDIVKAPEAITEPAAPSTMPKALQAVASAPAGEQPTTYEEAGDLL